MTEPRWVDSSSPAWPDRLAHLESPPPGFWQLGTTDPATPCVAVVGSRRATFQGVDIARSIGGELGAAGIQVVSGMALGIDAAAHRKESPENPVECAVHAFPPRRPQGRPGISCVVPRAVRPLSRGSGAQA